jgi:hypothetical protein
MEEIVAQELAKPNSELFQELERIGITAPRPAAQRVHQAVRRFTESRFGNCVTETIAPYLNPPGHPDSQLFGAPRCERYS